MTRNRLERHYLDLLKKYESNLNVLIYFVESGNSHILKVIFGRNEFCLVVEDRSIQVKYVYNYFSKPDKYNTITGFSIDNLASKMKTEITRRIRVGGFA